MIADGSHASAAALAISAGANVKAVQRTLGHATTGPGEENISAVS